jgi:hypothetical protein
LTAARVLICTTRKEIIFDENSIDHVVSLSGKVLGELPALALEDIQHTMQPLISLMNVSTCYVREFSYSPRNMDLSNITMRKKTKRVYTKKKQRN